MNQLIKAVLVDFKGRSGIIVNGHLIVKSDDFDDECEGINKIDEIAELLSSALRVVIVEVDVPFIYDWEKAIKKLTVRGVVRKLRTMM
ncbi:MAG: hypothetical protein ACI9T7_000008 [Oleiphilaceae bacterium]|jgi:hypothetical protein